MIRNKSYMLLATFVSIFILAMVSLADTVDLVPFHNEGKFGFYSVSKKKIAIPCEYQSVLPFDTDRKVTWVKRNNLYSLVDTEGKKISAQSYQKIGIPARGLFPVCKDKKWGVIDSSGEIIVPCKYDDMRFFFLNMCSVKKKDKWGVIDSSGEMIIPTKYDYLNILSKNIIAVKKDGLDSCIDKTGKKLFELDAMPYGAFHDGLTPVLFRAKDGARVIYINKSGKTVIPPKYCSGLLFNNKLAAVAKRVSNTSTLLWGYIDTKGKEVIPLKFQQAGYFDADTDLAPVKQNNHYGSINSKGEIVIPIKYEQISSFKEGLAIVKKNGLWGYINPKGKIVIPFKYKEADFFRNGIAWVKNTDNDFFYIDRDGKEFWMPAPETSLKKTSVVK